MAKFEHIFQIAVSVEDKNRIKFRLLKDEGIMLTKARTGVGYGPYEFELGTAEFEDMEKILRKQRKSIKKMLKDKVFTRKVKVRI